MDRGVTKQSPHSVDSDITHGHVHVTLDSTRRVREGGVLVTPALVFGQIDERMQTE